MYDTSKWWSQKCFEMIDTIITVFKQCSGETLVFRVKMLLLNGTSDI